MAEDPTSKKMMFYFADTADQTFTFCPRPTTLKSLFNLVNYFGKDVFSLMPRLCHPLVVLVISFDTIQIISFGRSREPKTCLGQVFILKLGCFDIGVIEQCVLDTNAEKQLSYAATDV